MDGRVKEVGTKDQLQPGGVADFAMPIEGFGLEVGVVEADGGGEAVAPGIKGQCQAENLEELAALAAVVAE